MGQGLEGRGDEHFDGRYGVKIARVFPRRTKATPTDELAYTDVPDMFVPKVDAVHVSVSFSWDLPRAEWLARQWEHIAPVSIGGPATGMRGGDFEPGMYLKRGYVITSRGCPNRCWFCSVWKREGQGVRELPITDGWNVLDDNLLACSDTHIKAVFAMLKRQKERPEFTGGLEAARLQDWHIDLLADLKPKQIFFAYDTPDDFEPLVCAVRKLRDAGIGEKSKQVRVYVLIGYPKDTIESARRRLDSVLMIGAWPMAMLWRDEKNGSQSIEWRRIQREYSRPAIMHARAEDVVTKIAEGGAGLDFPSEM